MSKKKQHPWRICPIGEHWVKEHPRKVTKSEKIQNLTHEGFFLLIFKYETFSLIVQLNMELVILIVISIKG